MTTQYKVTVPPATEPVTLADLRTHCRVFVVDATEDAYITALGKVAREYMEARVCRSFVTRTIEATLDGFPSGDEPIRLLYPPLQSVTTITYADENDVVQTLPGGDYAVSPGTPGVVYSAGGKSWPSTSGKPGSVKIQFAAGYGNSADVPEAAKLCIKVLVAQWYEQRMPITTGTIVSETPFMLNALAASLWWGCYY